ncbi:hypothetical protein Dimus_039755 [Dionaea muscipula]
MSSNRATSSKKDPAWEHMTCVNPNSTNDLKCNWCGKVTKGGIFRAKQHLAGGYRNARGCPDCPEHVRNDIRDYMSKKEAERKEGEMQSQRLPDFDDYGFGEDELDEVGESEVNFHGKRVFSSSGGGGSNSKQGSSKHSYSSSQKPQKTIGPLNTFFKSVPKESHQEKGKQQTINEV